MNANIVELVNRLRVERYKNAAYIFVYGSAAAGAMMAHSDIDLIVVYENTVIPFREKYEYQGYLFDVFAYDEESLNGELHMCRKHGSFVKLSAVMNARIFPAASAGALRLQEVARRVYTAGYRPNWSNRRQFATNIIEDLEDCRVRSEQLMLCVELFKWAAETAVIKAGEGVSNRKHLARLLASAAPSLHARLEHGLTQAIAGEPSALVEVAREILQDIGGPVRQLRRFTITDVTRMPLPVI